MTFLPILAAGEPSITLVVILIISVISWLVNLFQGNKPKKPPNRPRPVNQGPSELERFLQQVVGNQPEEKKPRPAPPKPARPANEKKSGKNKSQSGQRPPAPQRPAVADRPGTRLAQTHLTPTILGDGVRSHVASHLEPRNVDLSVQRDVDRTVQRDINDAVLQDMGADGTAGTIKRATVHPLIQALRNPQGVRQAIMLSEILNRPRSMR